MSTKPFAAATERNKRAILGVLREEFKAVGSVLEIGSGTGQHAVFFSRELAHLEWQPSDVADNLDGIRSWLADAALTNIGAPLQLDVLDTDIPDQNYDAAFTANTAHIMGPEAVEKMFSLVSNALIGGGVFVLYGPLRIDGRFNTESNEQFDRSLRQQGPQMGIRDLEALSEWAEDGNLRLKRVYAMPANNHIAVWRKETGS